MKSRIRICAIAIGLLALWGGIASGQNQLSELGRPQIAWEPQGTNVMVLINFLLNNACPDVRYMTVDQPLLNTWAIKNTIALRRFACRATSVGSLELTGNLALKRIELPLLAKGGTLTIQSNQAETLELPALTNARVVVKESAMLSFSTPRLRTSTEINVLAAKAAVNFAGLENVSGPLTLEVASDSGFPLLQNVGHIFTVQRCAQTNLSFPVLTNIGSAGTQVYIRWNSNLTSISWPQFKVFNGKTYYLVTNAFTAEFVNSFLAKCVGNTGFVSGAVDLRGNAAPTGQGLTDKATLQGRGVTVLTN